MTKYDGCAPPARLVSTQGRSEPGLVSSAGQRYVQAQRRSEGSILTRVVRALRWSRSLSIGAGR